MLKDHVAGYDKHVNFDDYRDGYQKAVQRTKSLDQLAENMGEPRKKPHPHGSLCADGIDRPAPRLARCLLAATQIPELRPITRRFHLECPPSRDRLPGFPLEREGLNCVKLSFLAPAHPHACLDPAWQTALERCPMLRTCSILALLLGVLSWTRPSFADERGLEFFEAKIRPVLVERCNRCHSAGKKAPKGGLRLDSPAGLLKGGDSGAVIAPGKVDESLLIDAIAHEGGVAEMPPDAKLPDRVIADFRQWVEIGAPLPESRRSRRVPGFDRRSTWTRAANSGRSCRPPSGRCRRSRTPGGRGTGSTRSSSGGLMNMGCGPRPRRIVGP